MCRPKVGPSGENRNGMSALPGEEEEAAQRGRLVCGPGANSVVCLPLLFVFLPDLVVYTRTMRI